MKLHSRLASPIDTISIKVGQACYAICLAVMGTLQLFYGDIRLAILPEWPSQIPILAIFARLVGIALVGAGAAIIIGKDEEKLRSF